MYLFFEDSRTKTVTARRPVSLRVLGRTGAVSCRSRALHVGQHSTNFLLANARILLETASTTLSPQIGDKQMRLACPHEMSRKKKCLKRRLQLVHISNVMANPETGAVFFNPFSPQPLDLPSWSGCRGCLPAKFVECWPSVTRLLKAVEEIKKMDE